jgi:hypothetical protein
MARVAAIVLSAIVAVALLAWENVSLERENLRLARELAAAAVLPPAPDLDGISTLAVTQAELKAALRDRADAAGHALEIHGCTWRPSHGAR